MAPIESTDSPGDLADRFGRVYEDEVWSVYGFIAYRVRSREEAEDLTQLTFERALKAFGRFDPRRATVKTWLLAIARNLVIDHFRKAGAVHVGDLGEFLEDGARHPDALVAPAVGESLGLEPELEAALGELSQRDREVVALRFGAEMTGQEIAHLTDLSLANVQQILSRSLRRMRERLGDGAGPDRLSDARNQRL